MTIDFGWLFFRFAEEVLPSFVPFAIALVVAFWPGERPERKLLFVFASAALSWGIPTVFHVLLMPFDLYMIYVEPDLRDQGYQTIPDFVIYIINNSTYIYLGFLALLSVVVPVYLRARIWPRLFPK